MKILEKFLWVFFLLILVYSSVFSGEKVVREDLIITNIEVPLRVFHKGNLVDGLKKSDFRLYENNKLVEINGFFINRKKIGSPDRKTDRGKIQQDKLPPRFFVLAFKITDYNDSFKKGISYLFDNLFRKQDRILAFINNKTIFLDKILPEEQQGYLEKILREESLKARQQLQKYFVKIRLNLNYTKTELAMKQQSEVDLPLTTRPAQVLAFLKEYLNTWTEYKERYLIPDIDNYYRFAEFLTRIDLEKWVINFYQTEMFPVIKYGGEFRREIEQIANEMMMANIEGVQYAKMIFKLLGEIDRELKVADDFDSEEVSRLFYKAGATFHSVLSSTGKEVASRDLEYRRISTDVENSMRQITEKTGGKVISSRDLRSALSTVSEAEDIYYMLTYAPSDPNSKGKIKVVVNNKKYKVVYDNNKRVDYIKKYLSRKNKGTPIVKINNLLFSGTHLNFEISDFHKKESGNIMVNIQIKDGMNNTISDKSRNMVPVKNSIRVSINYKWLDRGSYTILTNVKDVISGRTAFEYLKINVK